MPVDPPLLDIVLWVVDEKFDRPVVVIEENVASVVEENELSAPNFSVHNFKSFSPKMPKLEKRQQTYQNPMLNTRY